jgi:hypothetical protein
MIISNNPFDEVVEEVEKDQDSLLDGDLDDAPLLLTSSASNIETIALDQPAPSTPSERTGIISAITNSVPSVLKPNLYQFSAEQARPQYRSCQRNGKALLGSLET